MQKKLQHLKNDIFNDIHFFYLHKIILIEANKSFHIHIASYSTSEVLHHPISINGKVKRDNCYLSRKEKMASYV